MPVELYCRRLLRSAHLGTLHFDINSLASDGSTVDGWYPLIHPSSASAAAQNGNQRQPQTSPSKLEPSNPWTSRRGTAAINAINNLRAPAEDPHSHHGPFGARKSFRLTKGKVRFQRKAESAPTSPNNDRHSSVPSLASSPSSHSPHNVVAPATIPVRSSSPTLTKDANRVGGNGGIPGNIHVAVFQPGHSFTRNAVFKKDGVIVCGICHRLIILDPNEGQNLEALKSKKSESNAAGVVRTSFKSRVTASHIACVSCGFPAHSGCHFMTPTTCGHAGIDIRITYALTLEPVLDMEDYTAPFRNFIRHSEDYWEYLVSDGKPSLIDPRKPEDRTELATVLVELHKSLGDLESFLKGALRAEVDASDWHCNSSGGITTTAFRGSSTAIKCTEYLFKMVGMPWLRKTIGPTVKELVAATAKEISQDIFFVGVTERSLQRIRSSSQSVPPLIKQVMGFLRGLIRNRMSLPADGESSGDSINTQGSSGVKGQREDMPAIIVGSFVFLRFFSAALLGKPQRDVCSRKAPES